MMRLIEEMLTLSALESAHLEKSEEKVDLSDVVLKASLQMESVAYENGISFENDIAPDLSVRATDEQARKIVGVLLDNALKYEPEGGSVRVGLSHEKGAVVFSVQNSGSVIDPNDLPHVFERFYRADKARNLKKGHGLGLAIARQICDLIGARISVRSSPEEGTTFTVVFE